MADNRLVDFELPTVLDQFLHHGECLVSGDMTHPVGVCDSPLAEGLLLEVHPPWRFPIAHSSPSPHAPQFLVGKAGIDCEPKLASLFDFLPRREMHGVLSTLRIGVPRSERSRDRSRA